jgi:hypothetical protein
LRIHTDRYTKVLRTVLTAATRRPRTGSDRHRSTGTAGARLLEALGSALVGAVVGTLVAELRIYIQGRRERRRILSRVLFNQLEVLHGLWRRNPQVLFDAVIVYLAQRYNVSAEEVGANLRSYVDIPAILRELVAKDEDSSLEPVLAYRLRGRPKLAALEAFWSRYVSAVREHASLRDEDAQLLTRLSAATTPRLLAEALETIKGDAADVARLLGRRTRREVARVVRNLDNAGDAETSRVVGRLIDDMEVLVSRPPDPPR